MSKKVSMEEIAPLIRDTIEEAETVTFIATGTSMLPTLRGRKDAVTLVKPKGKLKKGDVAFYQRDNGRYVLHRVAYVNDKTYVMRGDNLWKNEYNIRQNQIIAVLASFDRNGKTHHVTDMKYKIYVKLLPVIRYAIKFYYLVKTMVYNFVKYLTNR